jgi:hypothetical protein
MSCVKIAYPSKDRAKAAARRARSTHRGRAMAAYRCATCGGWHIGHAKRGTVKACGSCGRRLTFVEGGRHNVLLPVDDSGRVHHCAENRR